MEEPAPKDQKVAVFDFDGTLLSQLPSYPIVEYFLHESEVTRWISAPAGFEGMSAGQYQYTVLQNIEDRIKFQMEALGGKQTAQVRARATKFFEQYYTEKLFKQQRLLISLMQRNGYAVWIVSGSAKFIIETFASKHFGVPEQLIIGTGMEWGSPEMLPAAWEGLICDGQNKVTFIDKYIGKKPLIAVGNTTGDIPMLDYAAKLAIMINPNEKAAAEFEQISNNSADPGKVFVTGTFREPRMDSGPFRVKSFLH